MANDVRPGEALATVPVKGVRAPTTAADARGKNRPQVNAGGKAPPRVPPPQKTGGQVDLQDVAERIGQHLRESGRPISFRVSSSGGRTVIHEVNPDTGEVIGEITSEDLLSLAHGLGLSGTLINSHA